MAYAIITENDESQWKDDTGALYHFPKRYKNYLLPGTEVIYYKGRIKNKDYSDLRLSDDPHYFAKAVIGKVYPDKQSSKGDLFATIVDYSQFNSPILAKHGEEYLEVIPENRKTNYWRDGARQIDREVYQNILSHIKPDQISEPETTYQNIEDLNDTDNRLESGTEGSANKRYVTTYERNLTYRKQAIAIHGDSCAACGFNFGETYGDYAEGYIHIHHVVPVSEFDEPKTIDPETDLLPLCANCHSVVHRKRVNTLSIEELKEMIKQVSAKKS